MGLVPRPTHEEKDFAEKLTNAGFEQGKSCPTVFFRKKHWLQAGGSLVTISHSHRGKTGFPSCWYDMKVRGILGGGSSDDEEVTILGRRFRWRRYQNHRVRG